VPEHDPLDLDRTERMKTCFAPEAGAISVRAGRIKLITQRASGGPHRTPVRAFPRRAVGALVALPTGMRSACKRRSRPTGRARAGCGVAGFASVGGCRRPWPGVAATASWRSFTDGSSSTVSAGVPSSGRCDRPVVALRSRTRSSRCGCSLAELP